MKSLAPFVCVIALAVSAFAEQPSYDFTARYNGLEITLSVLAPDGAFTVTTATTPDPQTITGVRNGRTYTIVIRGNDVEFDVKEKDVSIAHAVKSFGQYQRLTTGIQPPVVIERVNPHYPQSALDAGTSGIVIVETKISEKGNVDEARVVRGLSPELDEAAMEAVKQWKFKPATLDGKPVAVVFNLTINFRL